MTLMRSAGAERGAEEMQMKLLETFVVHHASEPKYIKLYQGDLAAIPGAEAVDILVVSAFPNDYVPTQTSLIGALYRAGLSVHDLALNKEVDLRDSLSCWLSQDLRLSHPNVGFRRVLCFEPLKRGKAPEVVGDVFRAVMPFAFGEPPIRSIAMPVLASGDQGYDSDLMLTALFDAAVHWFEHGMPVETIKIVAFAEPAAQRLRRLFAKLGSDYAGAKGDREAHGGISPEYDFFVSYAHRDTAAVDGLVQGLEGARVGVRVFQDKLQLKTGDAWQSELDAALESCRKVIAVYSPHYLESRVCMEEFNMARLRHRESESGVLLPIYLRTASLPLYMRSLQYVDCREGDLARVRSACQRLVLEALT